MSNGDLNWIANYIWGIADDVLRDLYVRGKYRDVILPMTVLRRLDAVLDMKAVLDAAGVIEQDAALRQPPGRGSTTCRHPCGRTGDDSAAHRNPRQVRPITMSAGLPGCRVLLVTPPVDA